MKHKKQNTWISLGSNIFNPKQQIMTALKQLSLYIPKTKLINHSSLYESKPLGPKNQPNFINAVALLESYLTPQHILFYLQLIEKQHGRNRNHIKWGPRTLDLDILLFENEKINNSLLTIPHYDMHNRAFVLCPLLEIYSNFYFPDGTNINKYNTKLNLNTLKKLEYNQI